MRLYTEADEADGSKGSPLKEVASIDIARASKFLHRLRDYPFVAFVFSDDQVRIYTKGVTANDARNIQSLVEMFTIPEEEDAED